MLEQGEKSLEDIPHGETYFYACLVGVPLRLAIVLCRDSRDELLPHPSVEAFVMGRLQISAGLGVLVIDWCCRFGHQRRECCGGGLQQKEHPDSSSHTALSTWPGLMSPACGAPIWAFILSLLFIGCHAQASNETIAYAHPNRDHALPSRCALLSTPH